MSRASVAVIGRAAGVSTGIIGHYFGGKDGLLEATMRFILKDLADITRATLDKAPKEDPLVRVLAIVESNFSGGQVNPDVTSTWLAFWSRAMHDPALYRLQQVNEKRLLSYLRFELKRMLPADEAKSVAIAVAALIDGMWLRGALAKGVDPQQAEGIIGDYIKSTVPERFLLIHQKNN
jgi:TetR/AcrR family transcriptional repressor of bet genes